MKIWRDIQGTIFFVFSTTNRYKTYKF